MKLLLSMTSAKQFVPFNVATEVLAMLIAFELLQEAGLRLPDPVGQTASIIGALIVGQSAVEAKVVSPIAVIVVALAGISGLHDAEPGPGLGRAPGPPAACGCGGAARPVRRNCRYSFNYMVCRPGLESFGKAYTAPFTGSDTAALVRVFLKRPNRANKFRSAHLAGENRRRQK